MYLHEKISQLESESIFPAYSDPNDLATECNRLWDSGEPEKAMATLAHNVNLVIHEHINPKSESYYFDSDSWRNFFEKVTETYPQAGMTEV